MKFGRLLRNGTTSLKIQLASKLFGLQKRVCANIALCRGRYNDQHNRRFVKIARGSLDETIRWLRLAHARQLLTIEQLNRFIPILDDFSPKLNAHLQLFSNK